MFDRIEDMTNIVTTIVVEQASGTIDRGDRRDHCHSRCCGAWIFTILGAAVVAAIFSLILEALA